MVPISPNIYSAEAIVLDNKGLFDYQQKLEDRRAKKAAAEQEAIDKYLENQASKLTPTGVRDVDMKGFEDRRQKWMTYAMQNKSKINKEPLLKMEADRLYNDALSFVQKSKTATEEKTDAIRLIRDPNSRKQVNTQRIIEDISYHDLSLDDPKRKKIDYNNSWYKEPEFDFLKEFADAAKGQETSTLNVVPGSQNRTLGTVTVVKGYPAKTAKVIADNFVRMVQDSPSKQDYYERKADKLNAQDFLELNKELVGTGLVADENNPLAIAYAEALKQARSFQKLVDEEDKALEYQRGMSKAAASRSQKQTYRLSEFDVLGKYSDKTETANIDMGGGNIYRGVKIVDAKNISARDRELIGVEPIKLGNRKVYYVKSNGDWEGKGNQVVSREGTARNNLDKTTKFETDVLNDFPVSGGGLPPAQKKGKKLY